MTDEVVIRVEKLGKKYSLRHQGAGRYTALRDVLTDKARSFSGQNCDDCSRAGH
jgi:lipopolysaccharide transport system ATP-binding protein